MKHLLIIGLGSIGVRHLKHFRALGVNRIDALRSGKSTMPNVADCEIDHTFYDIKVALESKPQGVVICTPSALHGKVAIRFLEEGAHVLCEKPLTHSLNELYEIAQLEEGLKQKLFIAHNLRFHPCLIYLKEKLKEFQVIKMVHAHFGAYLPEWHPWEDYKQSYTARKDLGGGALLTHIHEVDYLIWLFGNAERLSITKFEKSFIDTDVDEQSCLNLSFESSVFSIVTLSLIQKPASRFLNIYSDRGNLYCDLLSNKITFSNLNGTAEIIYSEEDFDIDITYRMQAREFIKAVENETSRLCTFEEQEQALKLILE